MNLRERKKLQTRNSLLAIAEELFSEKEFEEVKIDEIAARANVSQKTFFNYFSSKAELLEGVLLAWLSEVNVWEDDKEQELTLKSAITPPNLVQIQEWVVKHRHILKMIVQHTDLFRYVYQTESNNRGRNILIPPEYRKPRLEQVKKAQQEGLIRQDLSPERVCDLYDFLRFDIVQNWLALPDEVATHEEYLKRYDEMLQVFFNGISA